MSEAIGFLKTGSREFMVAQSIQSELKKASKLIFTQKTVGFFNVTGKSLFLGFSTVTKR